MNDRLWVANVQEDVRVQELNDPKEKDPRDDVSAQALAENKYIIG